MARGDHSLKRSAAAVAEAKPDNKKAKTFNNKPPTANPKNTLKKVELRLWSIYYSQQLHKIRLAQEHLNSCELQKTSVPRSLSDAVAKDKKDKGGDPKGKKDVKGTKTFKKKSDNQKRPRKEVKAPMTPAERRASKPNFALVRPYNFTNHFFLWLCLYCLLFWCLPLLHFTENFRWRDWNLHGIP